MARLDRSPLARPSSAALEVLWSRSRNQDQRAEAELLSQLLRALRGMARRELDVRGHRLGAGDFDDVVQDLLIEVWEKDLVRFDPELGSLLSFLKTRVRWRVADAVRRLARMRTDSLDEQLDEDGFDPVCPLPTPDTAVVENEHRNRLTLIAGAAKETLDAMGDDAARLCVQMHDLAGAPLRDVARALNVHPSNATRARQRGLRHLAQHLPENLREAA